MLSDLGSDQKGRDLIYGSSSELKGRHRFSCLCLISFCYSLAYTFFMIQGAHDLPRFACAHHVPLLKLSNNRFTPPLAQVAAQGQPVWADAAGQTQYYR